MIFVTVGTHYQGFERLIRKMDDIAGRIDDDVVMQIGSTNYAPKNARYFKFLGEESILRCYEKANVVVAHAGAGTLMTALSLGKRVVAVPRMKKFGEHIDDQQFELAEALSKQGRVMAVFDIEELERVLKEVNKLKFPIMKKERQLIDFLKKYIVELRE